MAMLDDILGEVKVPPPVRGVQEGLDPAESDELFSPLNAYDLLNLRVAQGRWETRLGQTLWQTLPGTGNVRLLANYYGSNGDRIRLGAQGNSTAGALFSLKEGTDVSFQAVSGGTGLGSATEPYFQIEFLQDKGYLTDRTGALRRYDPAASTKLVSIAAVVAPVAAPTVRTRTYAVLDDWFNIAITWAQDDVTKFELTDITASQPAPAGLRTAQMTIKSAAGLSKTVNENVSAEGVPSHTIAFWINQNVAKTNIAFEIGLNAAAEFSYPLQAATSDEWWPVFIPIGDIGSINFKQFKVIRAPGLTSMWVSSLTLPGRLEGQYRWIYTHYDPTTGRESSASPVSNGGVPTDMSAIGISNKQETARAFQKSAVLSFTSDSGTDATTTKIRVYRSGGVAELTKDSYGKDLWLRVAEVLDFSTTLSGGASVGDDHLTVTSSTGLAAGDCLVVDKGNAKEKYYHVLSVVGATVNLGLSFFGDQHSEQVQAAHSNGATVQMAYHDNTANETIDVTASVDIERDGPPTAIRNIRRAPNGRLWAFGYTQGGVRFPTGVAVSNLPTTDRPHDFETFPNNVDPNTRKSATQGFRTQIGGDTTDEAIQWGGFFQGEPYALTKKHLYVFRAQSQLEWGANAIAKVLSIGCLNGDTVAEVNGVLYWVTDGPRVVRWAGGQSSPEFFSHLKVNQRLRNAPASLYNQWFGLYHAKRDGNYYDLYFTPAGQTTNTMRLDFLADGDLWEPQQYSDASSTVQGFGPAVVRDGGSDTFDLYQAATGTGGIYQTEVGNTDDGAPIVISGTTKKFAMGQVSLSYDRNPICIPTKFWLRLGAVGADTITLVVTCSGSEYGTITASYPLNLGGSGEKEVFQRLSRLLRGRYVQFSFSGSVSNRPALRDMQLWYVLHRLARHNG